MSYQRQSSGLRLEVEHEANALISMWGSVALRRAEEASDERFMTHWDSVALRIARKSGKRPSLLGHFSTEAQRLSASPRSGRK
jgi:hypothetical protein